MGINFPAGGMQPQATTPQTPLWGPGSGGPGTQTQPTTPEPPLWGPGSEPPAGANGVKPHSAGAFNGVDATRHSQSTYSNQNFMGDMANMANNMKKRQD